MEDIKKLKKIVTRSNIVYFNGLTVKDRNFKPTIDYLNLNQDGLEDKVRIDFWDEENKILSLKSNY
jgi:hypothetical protein